MVKQAKVWTNNSDNDKELKRYSFDHEGKTIRLLDRNFKMRTYNPCQIYIYELFNQNKPESY